MLYAVAPPGQWQPFIEAWHLCLMYLSLVDGDCALMV